MASRTKNFENISINNYETDSFTRLDERDPDTNFLYDITKSSFETSYFKPNEVKPYLRSTQYLEKLNVLHVNIRSIKRNFENLKALLEECEFVFNIICVWETWCSNTKLQSNSNLSPTAFDSVPYERNKKIEEAEFWYILKRIFLTKFEKTFLNLKNIKKYFLWKFRIKIPPIYFWVAARSCPSVTMIF